MPKSLNVCLPHRSFHLVFIEEVSNVFEPIHTSCVFSKLIFRPDIFAKSISSFNISFNDFSEPSKNTYVSSAYCEILCSDWFISIPFIALLFLTLFDKNSAQIMNIYGDRGSPCRHPRLIEKKEDRSPFCITADDIQL